MGAADVVKEWLLEVTDKISVIDALELARTAGDPLTENVVMLGTISTIEEFPVPEQAIKESIAANVPKKAVEANLKAFDLGKETAYESLCKVVKCRK